MSLKLDENTLKSRKARCWTLAERLEETAQAIRYADKPHDLVFPTTTLIDLSNQLRDLQWQWVAEKLNIQPTGGKSPKV